MQAPRRNAVFVCPHPDGGAPPAEEGRLHSLKVLGSRVKPFTLNPTRIEHETFLDLLSACRRRVLPSLQDLAILNGDPRHTVMDTDCRFSSNTELIEKEKSKLASLRTSSNESLGTWLIDFFRYYGVEQLDCIWGSLGVLDMACVKEMAGVIDS